MPLFQEVWKIVGHDLNATTFTAKVDQVAETVFCSILIPRKSHRF